MTLLLLGCGGIYLSLGERQDSLMLLGFVVFIMGITLFQERKTERALEALRDIASPRALVLRDGRRTRIAAADLGAIPRALAFLAVVLYVPHLAGLFRFIVPGPLDMLLCLGGTLLGITWFEIVKLVRARSGGEGRRLRMAHAAR